MGNKLFDEASFERWTRSLQNFTWLVDRVPGATDMDCLIHAGARGGSDNFLLFEFKTPGERLPMGQRILLDALRKQPNWTVVTVYGPDDQDLFVCGYDWRGKYDRETLASKVEEWFNAAKGAAA